MEYNQIQTSHQRNRHFGCGSKPMAPFCGRLPPILVYFSGDWDVA